MINYPKAETLTYASVSPGISPIHNTKVLIAIMVHNKMTRGRRNQTRLSLTAAISRNRPAAIRRPFPAGTPSEITSCVNFPADLSTAFWSIDCVDIIAADRRVEHIPTGSCIVRRLAAPAKLVRFFCPCKMALRIVYVNISAQKFCHKDWTRKKLENLSGY